MSTCHAYLRRTDREGGAPAPCHHRAQRRRFFVSMKAANMKEPPCFIHRREAAEFTTTPIRRRRQRDQARGLTRDEMIGILDTSLRGRPKAMILFSPEYTVLNNVRTFMSLWLENKSPECCTSNTHTHSLLPSLISQLYTHLPIIHTSQKTTLFNSGLEAVIAKSVR